MKLRALIFDDEELIRNVLKEYFTKRGYETITYSEPGVCPLYHLDHCACEKDTYCADVILSDMKMPHVTGLELIRDLKNKECGVKNIALMSGYWNDVDKLQAHALGCKTFDKPFLISELDAWLDECENEMARERILVNLGIEN